MNSLWIAQNMVRRALGSFRSILTYLLFPVAIVSIIVSLVGGDSTPAPIAYVNLDQGPAGQRLLGELQRQTGREFIAKADETALKQSVTNRKIPFAILIPRDYSEALLTRGASAPTYYELNVTESSVLLRMALESEHKRLADAAALVRNESGARDGDDSAAMTRFSALLEAQSKAAVQTTVTDDHLYPRQGLNNVIGFTLLFLMSLAGTCVSLILEDRREGTMARIFTAPVNSAQIALGNFLGCFLLGWLQIALLLLVTRGLLHYDYGVPVWLHAAVLTAFMLVTIGLASALAGLVRNPDLVPTLNTLVLTPTCMLGGCFWPVSIMPDYLQIASNLMPQKWAIEAVKRISEGGGLSEAAAPIAILLLMAVVLLAIGSVILRPNERTVY